MHGALRCRGPRFHVLPRSTPSIFTHANQRRCYSDAALIKSKQNPRLRSLRDAGVELHPRLELDNSALSCREFRETFRGLQPSESRPTHSLQLFGRIQSIRFSGSKLVFLDLLQDGESVQALGSFKDMSGELSTVEFKAAFQRLQKGDVVRIHGHPQRTERGELSVRLDSPPQMLSPCAHPMPDTLHNNETRIKKRHVDLRINTRLSGILRARALIIQHIRDFLTADGHVEVHTPILADGASGAVARSFTTRATEFPERNINLRIAPELWLKRLVIGGLDRVFELGQSFRNEGLDSTHNPEFTTCEFYRAYTDLEKLMEMTQLMFSGLQSRLLVVQQQGALDLVSPDLNFSQPYNRLDFVTEVQSRAQCVLPDLAGPAAEQEVRRILADRSIDYKHDSSLPSLLDRLSAHYLEPECCQPTWIINPPECMSPLAKSFRHPWTGHAVSARAELFVQGKEVVNTYEEENSPPEQRRKFEQQVAFREKENESFIDESYLEALEWGLPPTGGWGCGIDRLCMLMTGATRISDVLTFGNLRNVVSLRQYDSERH